MLSYTSIYWSQCVPTNEYEYDDVNVSANPSKSKYNAVWCTNLFPRLPMARSFPALTNGYTFPALSRVCRQRLVDFLRLVNGCCTISGYSDLRCEDSLLILDSRGRTATPLIPLFCSEYLGHVTYSCLTESTSITLICSFLFFSFTWHNSKKETGHVRKFRSVWMSRWCQSIAKRCYYACDLLTIKNSSQNVISTLFPLLVPFLQYFFEGRFWCRDSTRHQLPIQ